MPEFRILSLNKKKFIYKQQIEFQNKKAMGWDPEQRRHCKQMKHKFYQGKFLLLAEIEPPKGSNASGMIKAANSVKGKVDAFVIPEMNSAVMRMSSLGGASVLNFQGLPCIMQICCRDRNRLALQADLLAANACGVSTILAVNGEEVKQGDHPQSQEVYDLNITSLLQTVQTLQSGRDLAGIQLSGSPDFLVGSRLNTTVEQDTLQIESREFELKSESGAEFFITPSVFDVEELDKAINRAGVDRNKIIPSVLLLKSGGMARYIEQKLSDVYIPSEVISRIRKAPDKEKEGVTIASEMIQELRSAGYAGANIVTLGWEDKLPYILS